MDALNALVTRFKAAQILRDKRGIAALEYALIGSLIALGIVAGATTFGSGVSGYLSKLGGAVSSMSTTVTK